MNEVNEIIAFLDAAIKAGATRAYLSHADEAVLAVRDPYSYRRYRKTNPAGKYKRKLVIMRLKEDVNAIATTR